MSPRLKISNYVIERLSNIDTSESTGCLYGLMYDGTLLVVGLSLELFENEKNTYRQLLLNLPAEIELCGVVRFGESLTTGTTMKEILQDVDITDNPLVMIVNERKEMKTHFLVHDKFEETKYEVLSSEDMWKQFLHVRLNTILPLSCEATISGVKNILQNKRKKIASGQVSFHVDGTSVYLFGVASDVGLTGTSPEATIGELVDSMSPEQPKKKKHNTNSVEIVPINLVLKTTKDILSDKLVKTAVKMMTTQRKPAFCISMPLRIDTLAMIHRNTKLLELYTVLVEAACRSLRLLESVLLEQLGQEGIGDGAGLRLPETFHFLPQELGHFITRVVPKAIPDESMEKERRLLHEQLGIVQTRPVFRRGNAYSDKSGGRLVNPHEAIPPQPLKPDVTVALVRGRYTYHHYMQDNFNDDGWGCAYRSMQTIFSWFRYQGYTTVEVPTHREIQQCLVNIGDKQSSFLGSKQWIGSTEVMFCLETLLGVQSRIIFANTGAELQSYAHDLVHHFQTHGSPIMIGGGVLAHTILGVEFNSASNEIRYLILDPHYTGAEDLSTVISKGWCGWKNSDFWNKVAHYNLCLPQTKPAI
uniref:Probable Ufm1-specific protease 2 n=1 Tax=Heliothis virescens TaxID=7102 RepID=A0A2A4JZR1_HELVI